MALAHTIPSTTERAYRRGDLLEKRRSLMSDWQSYIQTKQVMVPHVEEVEDGG